MYIIERMDRDIAEESKKTGKPITSLTAVFDMEGLSMRQIAHKPSNQDPINQTKTERDIFPLCSQLSNVTLNT